ncbi:MAG TPA: hypothetical protein VMR16_02305 [Candidatus Saccharimonadales bacterium]|nr:hypothetical protein [Candidatus Saccharimonadales bacterium]
MYGYTLFCLIGLFPSVTLALVFWLVIGTTALVVLPVLVGYAIIYLLTVHTWPEVFDRVGCRCMFVWFHIGLLAPALTIPIGFVDHRLGVLMLWAEVAITAILSGITLALSWRPRA